MPEIKQKQNPLLRWFGWSEQDNGGKPRGPSCPYKDSGVIQQVLSVDGSTQKRLGSDVAGFAQYQCSICGEIFLARSAGLVSQMNLTEQQKQQWTRRHLNLVRGK